MKHQGCKVHFAEQRNRELISTYRHKIAGVDFINIVEISKAVVNSPCSRFWVSEERAFAVVSAMLKHRDVLHNMHPMKREMYLKIYALVLAMRKQQPNEPLYKLVFNAVNSPAPKFYISPRYAMQIICKIRKNNIKTLAHHAG